MFLKTDRQRSGKRSACLMVLVNYGQARHERTLNQKGSDYGSAITLSFFDCVRCTYACWGRIPQSPRNAHQVCGCAMRHRFFFLYTGSDAMFDMRMKMFQKRSEFLLTLVF